MTTAQTEIPAAIGEHPRGSTLSVTVVPRASRNRLELQADGTVRARIAAPPVDGAANAALVKFLADALDLPRSRLAIESGESSRRKRIVAEGIDPVDLATRLRAATRLKG